MSCFIVDPMVVKRLEKQLGIVLTPRELEQARWGEKILVPTKSGDFIPLVIERYKFPGGVMTRQTAYAPGDSAFVPGLGKPRG